MAAIDNLPHLFSTYGYWVVGGIIALESMGLPLPGEATLIAAAIYAGSTQQLNIWLVIAAAAIGAILGDNIGYWIGREIGYRLLLRYGHYLQLTDARIKLGQYLFSRHGGKDRLPRQICRPAPCPCGLAGWRQSHELAAIPPLQRWRSNSVDGTL
jgi:membrane protein DedA with SNARE-associated domain